MLNKLNVRLVKNWVLRIIFIREFRIIDSAQYYFLAGYIFFHLTKFWTRVYKIHNTVLIWYEKTIVHEQWNK